MRNVSKKKKKKKKKIIINKKKIKKKKKKKKKRFIHINKNEDITNKKNYSMVREKIIVSPLFNGCIDEC